jgi:PAS domain S-box-containing protein
MDDKRGESYRRRMRTSDHDRNLQVWTYRVLCLLGALALPLSYFLVQHADPAFIDPLWLRLVLASLPLGLFGLSFASAQVREEISSLSIVIVYVLVGWLAGIAFINDLAPEYAVAGLVLIVGAGVVAGVDTQRMVALAALLATATAAMIVVALIATEPGIDRITYVAALLSTAVGLFTKAWIQQRLRRRLREGEERYRTIFERVADGIVVVDADSFEIMASNAAYRQITGFSGQDITSRTLKEILGMREDAIEAHVKRALQEGTVDLGEQSHLRRDGSRIAVDLGMALVPDEARQLLCLTVRDLTEPNRVRAQIETARDRAQDMLELRNAFLNNMSHELRTPLVSLTGFLNIIEEEQDHLDAADLQGMVASLRRSTDRLSETLNAILDLAQLEAGYYEIEVEPVDINIAVRDAVQTVMPLVEEKGLECSVHSGGPVRILADRAALHRIVVNIVANAAKFTPSGSVEVAVESDSHRVMLHVKDTGIGIDPEFLQNIFSPFRQASRGLDREHEGNGLGLTIAKRLLDLMGGRIRIESDPGQGTCVTLVFARTWASPDEVFQAGDGSDMAHTVGGSNGSAVADTPAWDSKPDIEPLAPRPRALIVEDNDDTARLMVRMLEDDFDVDRSPDAESGLARARGAWYDVLIIDVNPGPGMDGASLLAKLRAMSAYALVPAVAITTGPSSDAGARFLSTGFDAHLGKPFSKTELLRATMRAQQERSRSTS